MNSDSSLFLDDLNPDSLDADILSIALIGPDEDRRKAAASVLVECQAGNIREFPSYPVSLNDLPMLLEQHYDVIIIDLDSRPEYALELVESIGANGTATVMVYSAKAHSELLVRCMRAGAREFLTLPFAQSTVAEALLRASARRPATSRPTKKTGRLLAFLGAKGGDGVTTLACNFAVSLAQESGQSTLLIDLDLPLGDAALNLGVMAEYSTINALQNAARLDSAFLSKLLVRHSTGVSVLAAPGKFPRFDATNEAIDKLLTVARQEFDNVVIDMGSRLDLMGTGIFKDGSTVYLVIQAGIAGLRNSNRLISQYFSSDVPKLEIVLNRFQPRSLGVAEDQITKALTRPAQWKIPNDFAAVRRMQHTAIPLALEDSPISRLIRQMARTACGLPPVQEKGSGFSLKRIGRSFTTKISNTDETPAFSQLDLSSDVENIRPDNGRAASARSWSEATASISVQSAFALPAEPEPEAEETQPLLTAGDTASPDDSETEEEASQRVAVASQPNEPQMRIYQGATYVKGEDGQWHLQKTQASDVKDEEPHTENESPVIEWQTPNPIVYGVALSASQLNATAPVPGRYGYTPAADEVLAAGRHTLSVVFTPEDTSRYASAQSSVSLTVIQAAPSIAWSTPAPIAYGTALGATQLNAMSSVPGTFTYQPDKGEVLTPGVQALSVEFAPTDACNYTKGQAKVSLTVTLTTPVISWSTPAPIAYGTALSAAQLNATASVPGTLAYTPSKGEMLRAGEHTLSVSFTPANGTHYRTAGAAVALTVTKATPIVIWPAPASISSGTALSAAQLNAKVLVPGTLVYTPAAGEVLQTGTHTLSVAFTPTDTTNYIPVQATVPLTVAKATPEILWSAPEAQSFRGGSVLRASEFNAGSKSAQAAPHPVPAEKPASQAKFAHGKAIPKAMGKESVKPGAKLPAKTSAKQPVNAAAKHTAKAEAQSHTETPAKALIKMGTPQVPLEVGPGLDLMGSAVLEDGTTIYLVMQPGSAGVANSNRLVSQFFSAKGPKPDFVINRFEPRAPDVAEGQSSTALARPAYKPISRLIGQMARPASDAPASSEKKTGFSLKGFGRSIWSKLAAPEKVPSMTQLGLAADQDDAGTPLGVARPEATANINERSTYAPQVATVINPADQPSFSSAGPVGFSGAHGHRRAPETRMYMGALYAKGEDGQWHLQQTENEAVKQKAPAIPLPASTPVAGNGTSATEHPAASRSAWAEVAPTPEKKIVRKTKTASKNSQVKASTSKKLVKNAAKPTAKGSAKKSPKPTAKTSAKRLIKAAAKPAVKAPAGRLVKAAAKPLAKATATRQSKTAASKPAPASKRPVPASTPKSAKRVKASKLPVISQAPAFETQEPPRESAPIGQVNELMREG